MPKPAVSLQPTSPLSHLFSPPPYHLAGLQTTIILALSIAYRQKAEKDSFYRQGDRQCRFRLATAQCPAHMPMASTSAALVVPTPLARKHSVLEHTVRTAPAPASPASRTASELLQRHPPNPCPSPTDAVKNHGGWRGDKRVAAGPRASQPGAAAGQQQIGRGMECRF